MTTPVGPAPFDWYLIEGVNPEPWESPEGTIGRKGGKLFVAMLASSKTQLFQESLREEFTLRYGTIEPYADEHLSLVMGFSREVATYDGHTKGQANYADATNLQKATEDALQGILFDNDRSNLFVQSGIVAQGPNVKPRVLIGIRSAYDEPWLGALSLIGEAMAGELAVPERTGRDNLRRNVEDVF